MIGIFVWINGCASKPYLTMYENDQQMILKGEGFTGLPMPFFYPSMNYQNNIRCFKNHFCSLFPEFKESDFTKMNHPWSIMTTENGYSIGVGQTLQNGAIVLSYDISVSSYISPYSEREHLKRGMNYILQISINKEAKKMDVFIISILI